MNSPAVPPGYTYAHAIKIEALCRLGEMLRATERAQGRRSDLVPIGYKVKKQDIQTLDELHLARKTAVIATKLADLPQPQFEQVREGTTTMAQAIQSATQAIPQGRVPVPVDSLARLLVNVLAHSLPTSV